MSDRLLEVEGVSKEYRLGLLGGGTLQRDLASWYARIRGKEDPNAKIGSVVQFTKGDRFLALEDINLSVNAGDAVALVGLNGAGKSTLLKLISRITAPTTGEIRIRGRVASMLEVGTGFHPELTGRENIYLNGAILGMSRAEITKKLDEIIEFSEIEQFIDTPVKRYSSGMYVKLGFAVASNLDSEILICDEVLAVGDLAFQQKCIGKMSDLARDGRAIVYVSHNMRTVSQLCNRGIFLEKGRVGYDGTTEHAIEHYSGSGVRDLDRDLDSMPRPKNRGFIMRLMHMTVLNSSVHYAMDSSMNFALTSVSHLDEPRLRVRIVIRSSLATPIGMLHTKPFAVKAEETFSIKIKLPLDGLAPGEYGIKLSLVSGKPDGRTMIYDTIDDVGHFVISEDPALNDGFYWDERFWGNVRFKELEIE